MKKKKLKDEFKSKRKKMSSDFDVNGAYTGTPSFDKDEVPVQDVDDLWLASNGQNLEYIFHLNANFGNFVQNVGDFGNFVQNYLKTLEFVE